MRRKGLASWVRVLPPLLSRYIPTSCGRQDVESQTSFNGFARKVLCVGAGCGVLLGWSVVLRRPECASVRGWLFVAGNGWQLEPIAEPAPLFLLAGSVVPVWLVNARVHRRTGSPRTACGETDGGEGFGDWPVRRRFSKSGGSEAPGPATSPWWMNHPVWASRGVPLPMSESDTATSR